MRPRQWPPLADDLPSTHVTSSAVSPIDPDRFRLLTFDCYGTLVDWESGILAAARPVFRTHGTDPSDEDLLAWFAEAEHVVEAERYRKYRKVLALTLERMCERAEFRPTAAESAEFAASVGSWPAFGDTVDALRRLESRYQLGIVSNVDRDLFQATRDAALGVDFRWVVTAEDTGSYKPEPGHFREMQALSKIPLERTLHVAQSLFHDIAPANAMGYVTVHVDRRSRGAGSGATPPSPAEPTVTVPNMAAVAALLGR